MIFVIPDNRTAGVFPESNVQADHDSRDDVHAALWHVTARSMKRTVPLNGETK